MSRKCPECKKDVADARLRVCPGCGYQLDPPSSAHILTSPAVRPKLPADILLAITVDRTGSSLQFRDGIVRALEGITRALKPHVARLTCYLWTHGDEDDDQFPVLLTDGGGPDQMLADARTIVYSGGKDAAEHHVDGVANLVQMTPWDTASPTSRGVVIAFLTADSKPARSGRSARDIGEEIRRRGLLFYLICEPTPTLVELCNAAGGLMFEISNDPDPKDMQTIADQVGASITATVAAGSTLPLGAAGKSK